MSECKVVEVKANNGGVFLNPDPLYVTEKGKRLTVKWVLAEGSDAFRFVCLYFEKAGAPISEITINKDSVTCCHRVDSCDWEYLVTVMDADGNLYGGGGTGPRPGGRGVIRNGDRYSGA